MKISALDKIKAGNILHYVVKGMKIFKFIYANDIFRQYECACNARLCTHVTSEIIPKLLLLLLTLVPSCVKSGDIRAVTCPTIGQS